MAFQLAQSDIADGHSHTELAYGSVRAAASTSFRVHVVGANRSSNLQRRLWNRMLDVWWLPCVLDLRYRTRKSVQFRHLLRMFIARAQRRSMQLELLNCRVWPARRHLARLDGRADTKPNTLQSRLWDRVLSI